jgi:hypothetical protein
MPIQILIVTLNHCDAERFDRISYESLTRSSLDPDIYEAAKSASTLAEASMNLIKANGPDSADIGEAEILARKAVRVIKALKGPGDDFIMLVVSTLVEIGFFKKNWGCNLEFFRR